MVVNVYGGKSLRKERSSEFMGKERGSEPEPEEVADGGTITPNN